MEVHDGTTGSSKSTMSSAWKVTDATPWKWKGWFHKWPSEMHTREVGTIYFPGFETCSPHPLFLWRRYTGVFRGISVWAACTMQRWLPSVAPCPVRKGWMNWKLVSDAGSQGWTTRSWCGRCWPLNQYQEAHSPKCRGLHLKDVTVCWWWQDMPTEHQMWEIPV